MKYSYFADATKSSSVPVSGLSNAGAPKCLEFDAVRKVARADPTLNQLWANLFDQMRT